MTPPITHLHDTEARWFAVRTRFKSEKTAEKLLLQKRIACFLPIQHYSKCWGRKTKHFAVPLISGYIFVKIVKSDYIKVLETEGVVTFIRFAKNLIAIPDFEIELLNRIISEAIEVVSQPITQFTVGQQVEIAAGNLAGVRGTLVRIENKNQIVVELPNLGYALQFTIDASLVRECEYATAD